VHITGSKSRRGWQGLHGRSSRTIFLREAGRPREGLGHMYAGESIHSTPDAFIRRLSHVGRRTWLGAGEMGLPAPELP